MIGNIKIRQIIMPKNEFIYIFDNNKTHLFRMINKEIDTKH